MLAIVKQLTSIFVSKYFMLFWSLCTIYSTQRRFYSFGKKLLQILGILLAIFFGGPIFRKKKGCSAGIILRRLCTDSKLFLKK